jgi:arginyl-tRNA synthetase
MPQEGYLGQYVIDLARELKDEEGDRFLSLPYEEGMMTLGKISVERMLALIRADLIKMRVEYDCWFSEQSLFDNGQFEKVMRILREEGHISEKEGAVWFVSTALGENKDNVVIRSSGTPTYFGTDIAYHYNKFVERGFDRVIDIWGADHQGHVSRMGAVLSALGIDPARLRVIISQLVTLKRGGECVRVSKRSGDIITLNDVIDEVGVDACRFFFLARSADSQMDFDLELAKKESSENPVYYVQYAHARIASILRSGTGGGHRFFRWGRVDPERGIGISAYTFDAPVAEIIEYSARMLEPQNLPHYAQDLATCFHSFYKLCRVIAKKTWSKAKHD